MTTIAKEVRTFRVWYVYEGETTEYGKLYEGYSKRDVERLFNLDLIDASEDCPEKATILRIEDLG